MLVIQHLHRNGFKEHPARSFEETEREHVANGDRLTASILNLMIYSDPRHAVVLPPGLRVILEEVFMVVSQLKKKTPQ